MYFYAITLKWHTAKGDLFATNTGTVTNSTCPKCRLKRIREYASKASDGMDPNKSIVLMYHCEPMDPHECPE